MTLRPRGLVDIWFQRYKIAENLASAAACPSLPEGALAANELSPIDGESYDLLNSRSARSGHDETVEAEGTAAAGGQSMLHGS